MGLFDIFKEQMAEITALPDMPHPDLLAKMTKKKRESYLTNKDILYKQKVRGTITAEMSDMFHDDLEKIKVDLAARGLKVGKFFASGTFAYLFEIEGMNGQKVDSALLRIETAVTSGGVGCAGHIKPVFEMTEGYYHALIVPKAEPLEFNMKDVLRTLSVFNKEGKLKNITDMEMSQVMALRKPDGDVMRYKDGKIAAIVTDLNTVCKPENITVGLGNLASFATKNNLDLAQIKATKASKADVDHLHAQHQQIHEKVVADLEAVGINLEPVPTQQEGTQVAPVTSKKEFRRGRK